MNTTEEQAKVLDIALQAAERLNKQIDLASQNNLPLLASTWTRIQKELRDGVELQLRSFRDDALTHDNSGVLADALIRRVKKVK